jgi:hypothetical protein
MGFLSTSRYKVLPGVSIRAKSNLFVGRCQTCIRTLGVNQLAGIPSFNNPFDDIILGFCLVSADAHFAHCLQLEQCVSLFILLPMATVSTSVLKAVERFQVFRTGQTWLFSCLHTAENMSGQRSRC